MDKLTLLRTQPVQGHPVYVDVLWNGDKVGELDMPFQGWIKLQRLVQKGLEMDARENKGLQLQLHVAGKDSAFSEEAASKPVAAAINRRRREGEKLNEKRGMIGNAAEISKVEEDPELQRDLDAVLNAERSQEASSLREEPDGE